jgi:RHS repeat-associated protein
VNRISEARRYDRGGSGSWNLKVQQRYRYDAANDRIIKQSFEPSPGPSERLHLYVYPGDYERSGVIRDVANDEYDSDATFGTETQYMIGGARLVWKSAIASAGSIGLTENVRMTYAVGDVLGTTSAVIDVFTGALLETRTYYPNGAQESQRTQTDVAMQQEPNGFTTKEADDEVGITYFGQRYLFQHLGRWTTPDPLHVHAVGGGEALNSYHYVAGNLLQARDPLGLEGGREQMAPIDRGTEEFRGGGVQSQAPRAPNAGTMTVTQGPAPTSGSCDSVACAVPVNVPGGTGEILAQQVRHDDRQGLEIGFAGDGAERLDFRQFIRHSASGADANGNEVDLTGLQVDVGTRDQRIGRPRLGSSRYEVDDLYREDGYYTRGNSAFRRLDAQTLWMRDAPRAEREAYSLMQRTGATRVQFRFRFQTFLVAAGRNGADRVYGIIDWEVIHTYERGPDPAVPGWDWANRTNEDVNVIRMQPASSGRLSGDLQQAVRRWNSTVARGRPLPEESWTDFRPAND